MGELSESVYWGHGKAMEGLFKIYYRIQENIWEEFSLVQNCVVWFYRQEREVIIICRIRFFTAHGLLSSTVAFSSNPLLGINFRY